MSKRTNSAEMKVKPRFVYNPEKADQGLKAMADIIAGAIRQPRHKSSASIRDESTFT